MRAGFTDRGEDVLACSEFVNADLAIYANVNYVSQGGGFKSCASTFLFHCLLLLQQHQPRRRRRRGRASALPLPPHPLATDASHRAP